jgi:hypothetical protein
MALFNSFLSLRYFFLLSLVLIFFHFLLSSMLLIISCVIHGFLALFSTFHPDHWEYLRHIPFYCSTALQHSHCHNQLHRVFLLEYPALFVFEYIISSNPIVVFSFGTLWFYSIWCRSWQPASCLTALILFCWRHSGVYRFRFTCIGYQLIHSWVQCDLPSYCVIFMRLKYYFDCTP